MIHATNGVPFEAIVSGATPGLTGQITLAAYDPTDATIILVASTTGITEPASGTYRTQRTVSVDGTFMLRWAEPSGATAEEELIVSADEAIPSADATALGRVRLEIGDPDGELFTDSEIAIKLADRSNNVLLTAADLCDILATRFAREYDFGAAGGQSFRRSQRAAMYERRAAALRARALLAPAADGDDPTGVPLYNFPPAYPLIF